MREKRPSRPCEARRPLLDYSLNHPARLAGLAVPERLPMAPIRFELAIDHARGMDEPAVLWKNS